MCTVKATCPLCEAKMEIEIGDAWKYFNAPSRVVLGTSVGVKGFRNLGNVFCNCIPEKFQVFAEFSNSGTFLKLVTPEQLTTRLRKTIAA